MYHKIQPRADEHADLAVTVDAFRTQVEFLRRRGYKTLSLAELAQARRLGVSLPRRAVVFTFDDAYASVLEHAKPILDAAGFTATVFVVTQALGRHNFWDDGKNVPRAECLDHTGLQELARAGWEIGSHTATHANLTQLTGEPLARELEQSRRDLEALVNRPINTLSYPFGAWNPEVRTAAEQAGYAAACAISPGTKDVTADLLALRRVYVKPSDSPVAFRRKISGWYLKYRAWKGR